MLYACVDRITEESQGTVKVNEESLSDWEKNFIMIPMEESIGGKSAYELRYENGKIRFATQQEITDHLQQKEQNIRAIKRQAILDSLGLTEAELAKLKALAI